MLVENQHPLNRAATRTLKRAGLKEPPESMSILKILQISLQKGWVARSETEESDDREELLNLLLENQDDDGLVFLKRISVDPDDLDGELRPVSERLWAALDEVLVETDPNYRTSP